VFAGRLRVTRAVVLVVGLALLCCCLGTARAEAPLRVLVFQRRSPALARKILAEGRYAGFQMEALSAPDPASSAGVRAPSGAAAAIEVVSDDEVILTVNGTSSSGSEAYRLERTNEAESFPLRVVEYLRARLTDLGWALPDEVALTTPPAVVPAPLPPTRSPPDDRTGQAPPTPSSPGRSWRVWLNGGLGVLRASGGLGTSAQGLLGARLSAGAWGVAALALLPLASNELQQPEGEADVGVNVYLLQASYERRWGEGWGGALAVGPGLAVLSLDADATAPLIGKKDRLLCGMGSLELSLMRQLGDWFRVRTGVLVGVSAPRPVLSFAGRDVAAWGRVVGALSLRVEAGLPPTPGGD